MSKQWERICYSLLKSNKAQSCCLLLLHCLICFVLSCLTLTAAGTWITSALQLTLTECRVHARAKDHFGRILLFPKIQFTRDCWAGRGCVGSLPKLSVEARLSGSIQHVICLMKDTSPEDFGRRNQFNCQAVFMWLQMLLITLDT